MYKFTYQIGGDGIIKYMAGLATIILLCMSIGFIASKWPRLGAILVGILIALLFNANTVI